MQNTYKLFEFQFIYTLFKPILYEYMYSKYIKKQEINKI